MQRIFAVVFAVLLSATCAQSQIVINEICAANGDVVYDPDFFNFPSWVELYNAGDSPVDLSGYFISDSPEIPDRWQIAGGSVIAAKGYLLVWCDGEATGHHASFSLDSDGEEVILSGPDKQQIDRIIFPKQHLNVSYGRITDASSTWGYLISPTPGAANAGSTGTMLLENPVFSIKAGRYPGAQNVTITHPLTGSGAEIRYTIDGSEPTAEASLYTSPINIDKTTTLKAKAFANTFLPSKTEVKTYFINEHPSSLPVIALSTNPAYLNDNTIGIHVIGTNGIIGRGINYAANWNQNWWRHFDFEYFTPDGEKQFDESVDIRIHGKYSRSRPQKSLSLKARDKYGKTTIDYKIFPNKDYTKFGGLILRNSGNDWDRTMFRDAMQHNLLIGEMDVDYQDYQPAAIYMNGEYWGILNIRERIDGDYFESNYQQEEVDLLEGGGNAQEGTNEVYAMYMDSLRRVIITNPESIAFIERYIDVQEYINYMVANIYYANVDWPANNITYWRPRVTGGKFRWIIWDADYGFQLSDAHTSPVHPTLEWATDPDNTEGLNAEWSTRHFRTVLRNPVFRNRFIQTMTSAIQSTFNPDRVNTIIDAFRSRIADEMVFHQAKWANPVNWNDQINKMKNFAVQRNPYMLDHIATFFDLNPQVTMTISVVGNEGGDFRLNGVESKTGEFKYFKNLPYAVAPAPDPGYTFKEWTITGRKHERIKLIAEKSTWKYFDSGSDPGNGWKENGFDDTNWSAGPAQLGYGENDEQTVVGFGPQSSNKYITTYFRKQFTIESIDNLEDFEANIIFDDGAVVYVNGIEVYRVNLPAGEITFSTLAPRSYSPENTFHHILLDKGLFHNGVNTIAVEVHQNDPGSSDLSFELFLEASALGDSETIQSSDPEFNGIAYSDVVLQVEYERLPPRTGLVINEFCATASNVKDAFGETEDWIELYNPTAGPIDVGGLYITDNLDNKRKFRIPEGKPFSKMGPGCYLLLYADEDLDQGPDHLDFKLSSNGEAIGIYEEIGDELVKVDEVIYGPLSDFQSYARIPNGSGPFTLTEVLSPGAENPVVSATLKEPLVRGIFPNPVSNLMHVIAGQPATSTILDVTGRKVGQADLEPGDNLISLDELSPGVYFLQLKNGLKTETVRFIKR